jgi:hypothetical protein
MAEKLTRAQAIRKHCVECSGSSVYEANKCTVKKCYLWPYRRGSGWEDPDTGKIEKRAVSEKQMKQAKELGKKANKKSQSR